MDIRELRYFAAVFRERNLTAAAKRCFISQPSISAAITNLEAELGTALFIRHKKGMAPTEAAEQFHAVARRIIDEADAAKNLFRKPSTRNALTLGLMRTLDRPRTIALLKPLTGTSDIALRLVGVDEPRMRGSSPKICCAPTSISFRSGSSATSQPCRRRIR